MGGVSEGGVGNANKTSPRRAEIEKVQAELRLEYDIREERKRELEFLEKGGNPLEFVIGNAFSVSVQSTSLTDQHPEQFVTSEAKGSFAFTASPHGDSVESSGRPGEEPPCEPNSADNTMLLDAENEYYEGERNSLRPGKSHIVSSERKYADSAAFDLPRKAYRRRNRSRPNRDGARSSSNDANPARGLNISSHCNSKITCPVEGTLSKVVYADIQQDMQLDGAKAVESAKDLIEDVSTDARGSENPVDDQIYRQSESEDAKIPMKMRHDEPEAAVETETPASSCPMNGFSAKKGDEKDLDSESVCTQTNLRIDENNDSKMCPKMRNADLNGDVKVQTVVSDGAAPVIDGDEFVKETKESEAADISTVDEGSLSAQKSQRENGSAIHHQEELKDQINIEGMVVGSSGPETGENPTAPLDDDHAPENEIICNVKQKDSTEISTSDLPEAGSLTRVSVDSFKVQTSSGPELKVACIDEDSILKEAEIIEAKRKRLAELSILTFPTEIRRKSHWDYVLEEMAWLANDFAQERLWKLAASAQICHRAAFTSRLRKQDKSSDVKAKLIAHTLTKAVMEFWQLAEKTSKEVNQQTQKEALAIHSYAARFIKYNNSNILHSQAEEQLTPDRLSDLGDVSWEDNLTEENLFYAVPPGAMMAYRKSIESHVAQYERTGSSVQEECDTSACDNMADNSHYEDEGETSTHDIHISQKKQKNSTHGYGARLYQMGSDLLPDENTILTHQSSLPAKRPGSSLNVSNLTKRVRTAARRVINPYSAGVVNKTDAASSGDTNSFQDDQSTLRGGSNNLEVESVGEFEKHLPFDSAEVSTKKKKKAKNMNAAYEQRWQIDSNFQNEQFQRDNLKKRSENHQRESNGFNGLSGQPLVKKRKITWQSQDGSFDNITPTGGSAPSPVASQMSNMSNPNKFYKMLSGRDRGRKPKAPKIIAGQAGSGSPWSLFEDQALVVMVHDLGPNWELVSDAFNNTLQFKCIFRKAKECKERHKILMDKSSGDGADSAEDSGSSQPYPSTLPGIPKGSARQLFQRLKEPMEEDTLKSHREHIIMIGHKIHYPKSKVSFKNDSQDFKNTQPPHPSHTVALAQVCPNNLNGGPTLTPLDLCAVTTIPGPDVVYQGPPHSSAPNLGGGAPLHASSANPALQGAPNMMLGTNSSSSPGTVRDGRYAVPRSASLSIDEHQRAQQYNQMVSGINSIQQPPNMHARVRMPPGGNNGMGMMNRSMPMARPVGFQGVVAPQSLVNSGSMSSPGNMVSSANMPGNQTLRPRENSHVMMRPGPSHDPQRQMMVPEVASGTSSPHFVGLSSPFSSQAHHHHSYPQSTPQVASPRHPHFQGPTANHNPKQQQAHAIRLAKEKQMQQHRLLQQQQQQFAASSNSLQPQTQLPISNNQVQSMSPLTTMPQHNQKKPQTPPPQGAIRNNPGASGTAGKQQRQRQQQQLSQANRQHPQQKQQQAQTQQQAKSVKGEKGEPQMYANQASSSSSSRGPQMAPALHQSASKLVNQNHPSIQRVVNPDPSHKSQQPRILDTNQHATSNSTGTDTNMSMNSAPTLVSASAKSSESMPQESQGTGHPMVQHSQQQVQLAQAGSTNLYSRPSDPRVE